MKNENKLFFLFNASYKIFCDLIEIELAVKIVVVVLMIFAIG